MHPTERRSQEVSVDLANGNENNQRTRRKSMAETADEIVAVPVDLLKEIYGMAHDTGYDAVEAAVKDLLPKPKPRLVAFMLYGNHLDHAHGIYVVRRDVLEAEPDLLTLLDEAIDGIPIFGVESRDMVKARIRTALGVSS